MNKIDKAIKHLQQGGLIIVADDEDRESEGDLVGLAEYATPETINFMTKFGRGLICAPISKSLATRFHLTEMIENNTDPYRTAFTISIDHKNTSTGISAGDRAETIRQLANFNTSCDDFLRPGHIFPLIAKEGGVLERRGHTEAAVDLAKLSDGYEAAYICEILKEDGTMARLDELKKLAEKWELPLITVEDLTAYLLKDEAIKVQLPTEFGDFNLTLFEDAAKKEHLLLSKGNIQDAQKPLLVRVHSECLTGDIFQSHRCDCGAQLQRSMELIHAEGVGAILYLRQEGRGIGLKNKLLAYQLQEKGMDTYDANIALGFAPDERDYTFSAEILKSLGIYNIRLLTNNPEKVSSLEKSGVKVVEQIPLQISPLKENINYLKTKQEKFNHRLSL